MNSQNNTAHTRQLQSWAGFIFFSLAILFIYMPSGHVSSLGLFLSLPILYMRREEIRVDARFKTVFWLFVAYLVFFTLTSEHPARSLKGLYDMLRGVLLFPIALLWVSEMRSRARHNVLFMLVSLLIIGNLLFARPEGVFGYHPNPNNNGVTLWLFALFALLGISFARHSGSFLQAALQLFNFLASVLCLYLIFLTNARGVWLGLASGALVILFAMPQLKKPHKLALSAAVLVLFLAFFLFENIKGASLSRREEIWIGLFKHTVDEHFWLGYGINVVKDVLIENNIITQTAHNLFLEVFASTGVIGLGVFMAMLAWAIRIYSQQRYQPGPIFYLGLAGLTGLFAMAMFDLKFSSYRLIGMAFFFAGLIYSQRVSTASHGYKAPSSSA